MGHIETFINNCKLRLETAPRATHAEIYEFEKWRRSRMILDRKQFLRKIPNFERDRIMEAVEKIKKDFPQTEKIYLTGSFVRGDYINDFVPGYFWNLKQKVKGKAKISDLDFVTVPQVIKRTNDYDLLADENREKILLFER